MQTVTRFAPSPTGALHIGGVRTALYNWLYAKKHGGQFILRIEDTDKERSSEESSQQIADTMDWLALDHNALYYQSQRSALYQQRIQQLLEQNKAYYCHCSTERLDTLRAQQMAEKEKPRYDGHCRKLQLDTTKGAVIRLRTPQQGQTVFDDAVRGEITISNQELDDLILVRSDGSPTYNLSCVIDDAEMAITLVMRGDDHINNTPRQIHIYQALGYSVPRFAHLPMILGADGKRLSKRHGALSALEYKGLGYLPDALLNYLARLGWSHGDQEIFSNEELINLFSLEHISKAPASFSTEKLDWVNKQHMRAQHLNLTINQLQPLLPQGYTPTAAVQQLIPLYLERCDTLAQLADALAPYYLNTLDIDQAAAKKHLRPVASTALIHVRDTLRDLKDWQDEPIHQCIEKTAKELDVGMGKVGMPLRVAITGKGFSPSLGQVLAALDRDVVLTRIDAALGLIQKSSQ